MDNFPLATIQQEAYHHLRDRILSGDLPGKTRLDPTAIATSLGISRMPVREALRQLHAEGLVIMRPNRSAFVSSLTVREVEELFEIRAALEVLAVRTAMTAMTPDAMAELVALKDRMDRARHDLPEWLKRHDDFHQMICSLGGRTRLPQELGRIRLATRPYILMSMRMYDVVEMPGHEHSALLDALASNDVERAEQTMGDHVRNPGKSLIKFLQQRDAESIKKTEVLTPAQPKASNRSQPLEPA